MATCALPFIWYGAWREAWPVRLEISCQKTISRHTTAHSRSLVTSFPLLLLEGSTPETKPKKKKRVCCKIGIQHEYIGVGYLHGLTWILASTFYNAGRLEDSRNEGPE